MIKEAIEKVVSKGDLTYDEAYQVMNEIMSGESSQIQNAAYLAALSTKSTRAETIEEIMGSAIAMREHALPFDHEGLDAFEIVGTGGDHANSINISTASAIVAASAGVKVAKHGNRAASSRCGAADCLEALGINLDQSPEMCRKTLDDVGICFMFAQKYHTSMKYVGAIRKELGIRTVFNILGPLTNPAKPSMYVLGVYDEYLVEPVAKVLAQMGVRRALVVYGREKLDEISACGETAVCELKEGYYRTSVICPEDFGLVPGTKDELTGGTPEENAKITRGILDGSIGGTRRNAVLMNAAAGLYAAGHADTFQDGIARAAERIDSGDAAALLDRWITESCRK